MPEIKISEGAKSLIDTGKGSMIQNASGTIGDIISLLSKGEQLVSHIENIVTMFKGQQPNTGSSIIQSKDPAPPGVAPASQNPPAKDSTAPRIIPNDKDMEDYFSSPEGLKKIADAIDKMVPLIGDLKLSEVKKAIMDNIPTEKKTEEKKNESSTKGKTGNKK